MKIGLRNWKFEKTKVASNDTKLLRYCFIRGNYAIFVVTVDRFVMCCAMKIEIQLIWMCLFASRRECNWNQHLVVSKFQNVRGVLGGNFSHRF